MDILTGNELTSGGTVYLDKSGVWVEDLQAARIFGKDELSERDAVLAATKGTGRVINLEIEEVTLDEGGGLFSSSGFANGFGRRVPPRL
ncbi:MAG: DUF2849 domain-containing protein [Candidatus Devosia symbiotica]|nr:DUF2849 domain-containing protein [Candidatus Devosia symbiotica]